MDEYGVLERPLPRNRCKAPLRVQSDLRHRPPTRSVQAPLVAIRAYACAVLAAQYDHKQGSQCKLHFRIRRSDLHFRENYSLWANLMFCPHLLPHQRLEGLHRELHLAALALDPQRLRPVCAFQSPTALSRAALLLLQMSCVAALWHGTGVAQSAESSGAAVQVRRCMELWRDVQRCRHKG